MQPSDVLEKLQAAFAKQSNLKRAKEQQAYMKSSMPFWGIPVPEVRKISNVLFKECAPVDNNQYRQTILYLFNHAQHREEWYAGMHYANKFKRFIIPENIDLYLEIIRLTQWWDIVDDFAARLIGGVLKHVQDIKPYVLAWIADENMWVRRTALLTQLKYKEQTDADLLAQLILVVAHEKEFFIRKAIGWVLREYSYINPEWVQSFIKKYEEILSNLSIREGLKAIKRHVK